MGRTEGRSRVCSALRLIAMQRELSKSTMDFSGHLELVRMYIVTRPRFDTEMIVNRQIISRYISSNTIFSPMSTSEATPAPAPKAVSFARGVIALLSIWPALRVAVTENWGGPDASQKKTWLAGVIVDAFTENSSSEAPDVEYVEDMLLQIMEDEFDCVLEDGSAETVSKRIVKIWDVIASQGDAVIKSEVEKLEQEADKAKGKQVQVVQGAAEDPEEEWSGSDDESEEGDSGDEAPKLLPAQAGKPREEPVVDEDGFTLVQGKSKSGR